MVFKIVGHGALGGCFELALLLQIIPLEFCFKKSFLCAPL